MKKQYPCKCSAKHCRRMVYRAAHSDKCTRHREEAFKAKFPLKYAFNNIRKRAGQRGIVFGLTYAQYESFAIKTDYARLKGRPSLSLAIDRKDGGLGYYVWNIDAITVRENSRKGFVSYFNGGKLPTFARHEYTSFEKEYRDQCEKIAASVMLRHEAGSKQFWKEYQTAKNEMFHLKTA